MALFWRRKKEDRYITLGLDRPAETGEETTVEEGDAARTLEPPAAPTAGARPTAPVSTPVIEPVPTGAPPTPQPARESGLTDTSKREVVEAARTPPAETKAVG